MIIKKKQFYLLMKNVYFLNQLQTFNFSFACHKQIKNEYLSSKISRKISQQIMVRRCETPCIKKKIYLTAVHCFAKI